jgi:hypothetical protein
MTVTAARDLVGGTIPKRDHVEEPPPSPATGASTNIQIVANASIDENACPSHHDGPGNTSGGRQKNPESGPEVTWP